MNPEKLPSSKIRSYDLLMEEASTSVPVNEDKAKSLMNVLRGYEELIIDLAGKIISSNLEIVCITGYEEWEVIGRHFSMFYLVEDIESGKPDQDLRTAEINGVLRDERWKLKKRGGKFWAKIKILPMRDGFRRVTGYRITLRDETHKAFHDYKLAQQKKAHVHFYNYSTIGLLEFSLTTGRITMLNDCANNLLGKAHDVIFLREIFEDQAQYDALMTLIANDRHTNNFEFQLKNRKWVSLDCKFFLKRGLVEALMTEITDRKFHEQRVASLSEDLETFLYHASHDLRSPLTSVLGLLNLMERELSSEQQHEYLAMVRGRIDHLDTLLRELTAVTFNNAQKVVLQEINVRQEIEYVLEGIADKSYVHIQLNVTDELTVETDLIRFRVIMKNVISNAVKFRNRNIPDPYLIITVGRNDDNLCINVTDNGMGIGPQQLEKIYDAFFRGHTSLSGNGLGLYIVKSMVAALNGTIDTRSTLHEGTSVNITLRCPL